VTVTFGDSHRSFGIAWSFGRVTVTFGDSHRSFGISRSFGRVTVTFGDSHLKKGPVGEAKQHRRGGGEKDDIILDRFDKLP